MGKQPVVRTVELAPLSAAVRHLRDAEQLADPTNPHLSLDQAYHLAGFGPECAREAAIAAKWANKPLGHDLGKNAEAVLELALTLDPSATRYALQGWGNTYPALARWSPARRCAETQTHKRPQVEALLSESRRVVVEIMAALWANEETIPVHRALHSLLLEIRDKLAPAYILLDARAGLHDLAGLSLHGLAHVDVLVTRASEQSYRGLDLTVRALGRRTPESKLRCVTVHGFAPPDAESPEGKAEIAEVRDRAYKSFSEHVYEEVPAEEDNTAAHFPWPLRRNPNLERFTTMASVLGDLRTEQHARLLSRIEELCTPEISGPDEPDEEDWP